MNIRKNQSGNWQVRMMIDNKMYYTTFHGSKPTEMQAYEKIMEQVRNSNRPKEKKFIDAAEEYNKCRKNIISPSTYREYSRTCGRLPEWFVDLDIYTISNVEMQRLTNELSASHSAKTVHNYHGYCTAVITFFRPDAVFKTTFKQSDAKTPYIPTKEEVQTVIDYSAGTEYHIPLQLAKYSLRRSEICALLKSDLTDDNQIHVCKALVEDIDKQWVVKQPKTKDSDRFVPIDDELANEIRALDREEIYPYYPQNITNYLIRTQKKLGLPHFTLHKLRHFFASELHGVIPEADIMEVGGWRTNNVLRQVYTHSKIQTDKNRQRAMLEKLGNS